MRVVAFAIVIAVAFIDVAMADTAAPWSVGVSDAKKTEANRLLEQGNALFLDKKFGDALVKYREAVAAWDHPAIRFNIVRCLIQLDRAVEAADNLKQALRYGAAPLEEAVYNEALAYEKLLAKQIGSVTIECKQRDVVISLDGQKLGACPMRQVHQLSPGKHQVLGTGTGLLARAIDVFVVGAETQDVGVSLATVPHGGGLTARSYGKAALYVGGGVLVAASGLGIYAWRSYRGQFPDHCTESPTGGAPLCDESGVSALDRSLRFGDVATIAGTVGAALAITGIVVLWRFPKPESTPTVTPTVTETGAGVAVFGTF